jgi:hypothetical protein
MKPEFRYLEMSDIEAVVALLPEVPPNDQPHHEPAEESFYKSLGVMKGLRTSMGILLV